MPATLDDLLTFIASPPPGSAALTAALDEVSDIIANSAPAAISVKNPYYGAKGDSVTDDTTAITKAVADAVITGQELYFPAGTYLTTASIPNLHTVRKRGPGIISRNGNPFHIEPSYTETNIIFVNPNGNDSQDGLASSTLAAVKTLQGAFNIIQNYGPILRGTWTVSLAAGTYTEGAAWSLASSAAYPGMRAPLNITGPNVNGAEPTAIIDGTTATKPNAILLQGPFDLLATAVEMRNFPSEAALMQDRAEATYTDCWCVNNGDGFVGNVHCSVTLKGACLSSGHINTGSGFGHGVLVKDHSTFSSNSGPNGTPTLQSNAYGLSIAECGVGHAFALNVQDNTSAGLSIALMSRLTLESAVNIKRHTTGDGAVFLYGDGVLEDAGATWNDGTADRNYPRVTYHDFSVYRFPIAATNFEAFAERIKLVNTATITLTGSIVQTTLLDSSTATIPFTIHPNDLTYLSRKLRVRVAGSLTGTNGAKTVNVKLGGNLIASQAFASTNTGAFIFDVDFLHMGANDSGTQLVVQKSIVAVGTQPPPAIANTAISMNVAADMAVTVTGQLANAADTITVNQIEMAEV